jgi:hypothetical protein
MSLTHPELAYAADDLRPAPPISSSQSGISWAAIFAGGITAAAISIILGLFGAGLGLSSVSPWPGAGVSLTSFTVLAAIWLIIVQWVAALFGGYMAGRLRVKWVSLHTDEVFFRDTAHGFLAWALGTLIVAALLTSSAIGTARTAGDVTSQAASIASANGYYVDMLFRQNANPAAPDSGSALAPPSPAPDMHGQAGAILAQGIVNGGVNAADSAYLAQLVSEASGLAPADAQARVNDVLADEQAAITKARQAADATRKAGADAAIYTFISLLIGAFIASVSGAIGGRLRDNY